MSKERSPRGVCSTTIGIRELVARPTCMWALLSGARGALQCNY
jgi:hypothetical protein